MLSAEKLKKRSVTSSLITFETNKNVPKDECINPYAPFYGVNGKKYLIGYDKKLYETTNCYAFAMGWLVEASNKYDDYVPGFLAGVPYSVYVAEEIVRADLEAVGRKVYEVLYDIPKELPDGEGYWIKFLHCPENGELDAHFMRKDKKSGRWIHKMGWSMPPKLCVRNLEFKEKMDVVLSSVDLMGIPRAEAERLIKAMLPKEVYSGKTLVKSEIETDDSAGYVSFSEADKIVKYQAVWAMRISEP